MKLHLKDYLYFCSIILIPSALLFKQMIFYSLIAYVVSVLLFNFDPLILKIRRVVEKTEFFYYAISIAGFCLGVLSSFIESTGGVAAFVWILFFLVYGHNYSDRMQKFIDKE